MGARVASGVRKEKRRIFEDGGAPRVEDPGVRVRPGTRASSASEARAQRQVRGELDASVELRSRRTLAREADAPAELARRRRGGEGATQRGALDQKWKVPPAGVRVVRNRDAAPLSWIEKWRSPTTGRWVHNYTLAARVARERDKFESNRVFGRRLPEIRARYRADLDSRDPWARTLALIVALIDQAYFRVGNESSDDRGTHGITTLHRRHVRIDGQTVRFDYIGKKRVEQHKVVCDAKLAKLVRGLHAACQKRSDRLFRVDGRVITAADVNAYLGEFEVTAKQFRTYHATRLARELLLREGVRPPGQREDVIGAVVERVAERIGHDPGTCRAHYIDPVVLRAYAEGRLR